MKKFLMIKVKSKTEKLVRKKGLKQCKEEGNTGCYVHYSGKEPTY